MEIKEIAERFKVMHSDFDIEVKDAIDHIKVVATDRKTLHRLPGVFMGIEIRGVLLSEEE